MQLTTGQRLAAAIALAVLLVSGLGLGTQYFLVKRDLQAKLQALVQADLAGFAALYDQRRVIAVRQAVEFRKLTMPDITLVLLDRNRNLLAGTVPGWPQGVAVPAENETAPAFAMEWNGQSHLAIARSFAGDFPFLVARPTAENDTTLRAMRRIIWAALAAIAIIGVIMGTIASRWILHKIARINGLADRVAKGDLTARLPGPAAADEFGTLQRHFHDMLDRIEALNRATHHLSDTVAHELRTPLTRIQTRLSQLKPTEGTEEVQQEIRTTIRIFDSLLEIARAEAAEGVGTALPLDLSALLAEVCELYEPVAETQEIALVTEIPPGITVLGDRNLIAQLIANLLENALKFTPVGESITVALQSGEGPHLMRISDTGQGLPPGFETKVFDRFSRAETVGTTPGHGLGLALVRAVALRYGAKLSLPKTEKGFSIEIAWPKVAAM